MEQTQTPERRLNLFGKAGAEETDFCAASRRLGL